LHFEALHPKKGASDGIEQTSMKSKKMACLVEVSDEEDSDDDEDGVEDDVNGEEDYNVDLDWEHEYNLYISQKHQLNGLTIIEWWALCNFFSVHSTLRVSDSPRQDKASTLPSWTSFARDYLPIMASSIPSEHIFSGTGITITKRRNRLKSDIVKAVQVLKAAYRGYLFPEYPSAAMEE
jgi:hypothetical protein